MSALDFSHFKKIAQDKKSAILLHPDGHQIKIAIGSLNPALRKKLEALPLHQAKGSKEPVKSIDDDSPAIAEDEKEIEKEIEETPPQAAVAPTPQAAPVAAASPAPSAPPEAPVAAPASAPVPQAPQPPAPAVSPIAAAAPATAQAEPTPDEMAAKKTEEDLKFAQDLHAGHITPKTYSSLFAEKSTAGKIGTIFGLMLSGIGSGLSHQSNAYLAMMDKQIQNDLEAQKTDQSNKQNWYKMSIDYTRAQTLNDLTESEVSKNWTENEKQKFLNDNAGALEGIGTFKSENKMMLSLMQIQQDAINKMPMGPERDRAQDNLNNQVMPTTLKKIEENNKKAAGIEHQLMNKAKTIGSTEKSAAPPKGTAESGKKYSVVNQDKLNDGFRKGLMFGADAGKIPGAIPPEKHAAINKEIEELTVNRNNLADAEDSFKKLSEMKNAGQVPGIGAAGAAATTLGSVVGSLAGPLGTAAGAGIGKLAGSLAGDTAQKYFERDRGIQVEALKSRLGGGMSEDDKQKLADSLLPSWSDTSASMAEAHRKMIQHFESNPAEAAPNLTQYGLKLPMPKYEFKTEKKKEVAKEKSKGASGGF